jgi:hypothetical protein
MSLNQTLLSTVNSVKPYLGYVPLFAGTNLEPSTSAQSSTRNTILRAPFCWAFNRGTTSFALTSTPSTPDYSKIIPDFGFIEEASVTDDQGNTHQIKDVYNTSTTVAQANEQGRPNSISVVSSDGLGNVTFRFLSPPDKPYTATVIYQKAPSPQGIGVLSSFLSSVANASGGNTVYTGGFSPAAFPALSACLVTGFTNAANNGTFYVVSCTATQLTLANTAGVSETPTANTATVTPNSWAPMPDFMADVYRPLFFAEMMAASGDERAGQYRQRGMAALLSKLQGLENTQKNPFMQQWLTREMEQMAVQLKAQQYIGASGI